MDDDILESEMNTHGCCHKNKCSICLCILLLFATLLLLMTGFFSVGWVLQENETQEECTTVACVQSAAEIAEFVDTSVDPCEDFYTFLCGKFIQTSYEKQINNPLDAENARIKRHLDSYIVEEPSEDDPQAIKLQKNYFRACLNEEEIEIDNDRTFLRKLNAVGDWPILQKDIWDEKRFDWINAMRKARSFGLPFEWFLRISLYEEEEFILQITHPENCGTILNDDYFSMQKKIFEQFTTPVIDTIRNLQKLREFELKLHSICLNGTNFEVSQERLSWVTQNLGYPLSSILGHSWTNNIQILVEKNYIHELKMLLVETNKTVQADYISWKIIEHFIPYLSTSVRKIYDEYTQDDTSRFDFCLEDTKKKFKYVSVVEDLKNYDQSTIQEVADELTDSIVTQILNTIEDINWKSNKTRDNHLDLFENIEVLSGGPDEIFEEHFFAKYTPIGKLTFMTDNIIQMLVDYSEHFLNFKIKMIGQPTITSLTSALEANSDFFITLLEDESQLILPASIFNSILYKDGGPQYLNYAGLGSLVSTKMVRAFRFSETTGNEPFFGFKEKRRCFIDKMQKSNKNINASLFFFYNYQTILGQHLAYEAYKKYVKDNEEETPLVGLPYTPNKIFWIKSNLNWCYHPLPDEENPTDMQEMLKYRILENVRNSEAFAEDFQCAEDTPMNPKNKCSLL